MKLTKVDITNFRCFESLAVPLQPDVNVFVGVNASGKTAMRRANRRLFYRIHRLSHYPSSTGTGSYPLSIPHTPA
jgi:predicted ATP-dependent endonuclease of OLD family